MEVNMISRQRFQGLENPIPWGSAFASSSGL